jgi:hypothetical protein
MTRIARQARAELLFLHFSRRLLLVGLVLLAAVVVSFTGSVSAASSANDNFVRQVAVFEKNGVALEDALKAPMSVSRDGPAETIDNPLKYDYLGVAKAVASVHGTAMAGTALDLSTFIVIPLLFLVLGAGIARHDPASGSSQIRASRERWGVVVVAKVAVLGLVAGGAALLVAVGGLVAPVVGSATVDRLRSDISYDLAVVTPSPLLPKVVMTVLVAVAFGLAGYAIAWSTHSTSWPMVAAALALFTLPFLTAWDPRNVLAVLGYGVYDFWGQFQLRPPIQMAHSTALVAALGYTAAVALMVAASARRVPLR